MTHLTEFWDAINTYMPRGKWVPLQVIYILIERNILLDAEDMEPQSPTSNLPKWKRNVRNVLQIRKDTREIQWNGKGYYLLP